jgi:cell division protein WhiA
VSGFVTTPANATFTRAVRGELSHLAETRVCCRLAEIAALLRTAGTFHIRGGVSDEERYGLHVATTVQSAAALVYSHFKLFGAEGRLYTRREPRLRRRLVYEVHFDGSAATLQALNELGVISDRFRLEPGIPARLVKRRCCKSAFLRGCFLGAGSVNPPLREAHLELLTPHEDFAADLAGLLRRMEYHPGVYNRRGTEVVYLKGRDEVAQLLAFMGAQEAALRLEEAAVFKEVRAQANRLANCDEANSRRSSDAAVRQLEAIDYLERVDLLGRLPTALREMADLRREHPYSSLVELADKGAEPLSRSALNHRLRRLVEAAEEAGYVARQTARAGRRAAGPTGGLC